MNRLKPESFLAKTYQNHLAFSLKNNYNEVVNSMTKGLYESLEKPMVAHPMDASFFLSEEQMYVLFSGEPIQ